MQGAASISAIAKLVHLRNGMNKGGRHHQLNASDGANLVQLCSNKLPQVRGSVEKFNIPSVIRMAHFVTNDGQGDPI